MMGMLPSGMGAGPIGVGSGVGVGVGAGVGSGVGAGVGVGVGVSAGGWAQPEAIKKARINRMR